MYPIIQYLMCAKSTTIFKHYYINRSYLLSYNACSLNLFTDI